MKRQFQSYENWHPQKKINDQYLKGYDDSYIEETMEMLRQKRASMNKMQYQ